MRNHSKSLKLATRDIRAGVRRPLRRQTASSTAPAASAFAAAVAGRYTAGRRFWSPLALALAGPPAPRPTVGRPPATRSYHTTVNVQPRLLLTYLASAAAADPAPPALPSFRPRRPARLVQVEQRTMTLQRIQTNRATSLLRRVLAQGRRVEGWQRAQPAALSTPAAGPMTLHHPPAEQESGPARHPALPRAAPVRRVLRQHAPPVEGAGRARPDHDEPAPASRWGRRPENGRVPAPIQGEGPGPAQPVTLPPQELNRVADHVMQTLERRVHAFRERTGRI